MADGIAWAAVVLYREDRATEGDAEASFLFRISYYLHRHYRQKRKKKFDTVICTNGITNSNSLKGHSNFKKMSQ